MNAMLGFVAAASEDPGIVSSGRREIADVSWRMSPPDQFEQMLGRLQPSGELRRILAVFKSAGAERPERPGLVIVVGNAPFSQALRAPAGFAFERVHKVVAEHALDFSRLPAAQRVALREPRLPGQLDGCLAELVVRLRFSILCRPQLECNCNVGCRNAKTVIVSG
jgi:hypothetical protein